MVPMPCASCAAAAAIASSRRSPGMNVDTARRTNAVFVARSRSHALVDIANRIVRAMLTARLSATRNPRSAMSPSQESLQETAVHLQGRSGDVRGGVGEQECAGAAELVRIAVAAGR